MPPSTVNLQGLAHNNSLAYSSLWDKKVKRIDYPCHSQMCLRGTCAVYPKGSLLTRPQQGHSAVEKPTYASGDAQKYRARERHKRKECSSPRENCILQARNFSEILNHKANHTIVNKRSWIHTLSLHRNVSG